MPTDSFTIASTPTQAVGDSGSAQQSVTEQIYQRNRELLQERRRAEDLLYNVSEAVFAVDKDFKITIFNHTIENMLSLPEGVATGQPMDSIIKIQTEKGEQVDLKQYCFTSVVKNPILSDVVLKGTPKDYFVNVKFSVIRSETNPEESECLITISDITKQIMLDKAKDDFLILASHELRTPMTIIKSYLWMLQNGQVGPLNKEQQQYVDTTLNSSETMISMINDMLNISKMEQGRISFNMKANKIVKGLRDAVAGFDLKAKEKNIFFKLDIGTLPEDLDAYYDDGKFKECMSNLVGNAIKFTIEGGVTVTAVDEDKFVKISVVDTGVGISPTDIPKLFTKFGKGEKSYIKSESTGGTGLGLYTVRMYVEAMGGQMGYSSEGDFKGSTFWITLPKYTQIHD